MKFSIKYLQYYVLKEYCILGMPSFLIQRLYKPLYYTAICAIAKDETEYIVEWLDHYIELGIEHFFIYDNNSIIPLKEQLSEYIKNGIVTVYPWKYLKPQQMPAYQNCLNRHRKDCYWLGFIDIDEFLILHKHNCIKDLLGNFENHGAVGINWLVYNSNGHNSKPAGKVIDNYTKSINPNNPINRHIKSFVNTKFTLFMFISHSGIYIKKAVNPKGIKIHSAYNPVDLEIAQFNHYYTKSFEEWKIKISKGRVDLLDDRALEEFYEIEKS